jgi:hypothetical protein
MRSWSRMENNVMNLTETGREDINLTLKLEGNPLLVVRDC